MAEKQDLKLKLCDEEKSKLIDFFKVNKALWSSSTNFRDKEEKVNVKKALVDLFDGKFTETFLEKQFHALRTAFNRESKKYKEKEPKKKWKFFEQLQFLQDEIEKEKRVPFDVEERETLIDFYSSHPALWNHHLAEYRDRNLRDSLFVKLLELFDNKFRREDITQEWHNLLTIYKREKKREEGSTSSGSGSNELYVSNWEHFTSMEFYDVTGDVDDSFTSLDSEVTINCPPKKVKRQRGKKQTEEDNDAKTELWKSISASLKQQPAEQKKTKSRNERSYSERLLPIHYYSMTLQSGPILRKRSWMCSMILINKN